MSPLKIALFAAAVSAAGGMCHTTSLAPGTTFDEARAKLGKPTGSYSLPAAARDCSIPISRSTSRSGTPILTRKGGSRVEQMMTDAAFARVQLRQVHTRRRTARLWPTCRHVRLQTVDESAWMYRYFTYGGFKAAMFVYFDPAGVVKRTETGLDPWAIRDGGRNN